MVPDAVAENEEKVVVDVSLRKMSESKEECHKSKVEESQKSNVGECHKSEECHKSKVEECHKSKVEECHKSKEEENPKAKEEVEEPMVQLEQSLYLKVGIGSCFYI